MSYTHYLQSIENPNDTGILCNFKQHSVKLLTFNSGLPHYPNYELGSVADKCGESGIKDNEMEKIEVYPNPASEYVQIMSDSPIDCMVDIYNSMGQKVLSSRDGRIDVSALNNGIYLLKILDKRDRIFIKKIRIQR